LSAVAGSGSAQRPVPVPEVVTPPPAPADTQPELPGAGDATLPPSAWTISFALSSSLSRMTYDWQVGPRNAGSLYSSRGLSQPPTTHEVSFRASDAALRALKARLTEDHCCAAFRSSTCRVLDAPPASIAFSMAELQCAARATPECTDEKPAQRCFQHLKTFLRASCGARCE